MFNHRQPHTRLPEKQIMKMKTIQQKTTIVRDFYGRVSNKLNDRRFVFLLFSVIGLLLLFAGHLESAAATAGLSVASMAAIGHIDDVSDRDTHGSSISYIVCLLSIDQLDRTREFPQPNAHREVAAVPLKPGEIPHYFEAHDIPTFTASTEKGDITTTGENSLVIIMGGARESIYNFIEEFSGGKFIAFYKHVKDKTWYIVGELERPLLLSSTETKDDKDGRYSTLTFKRPSVDLPLVYAGNPLVNTDTIVPANSTSVTITPGSNVYKIANGTSSSVAIANVDGLTKTDKGRYITFIGDGSDKPSTISDGTTFILEDGATWKAKAGASITFRILDTSTLVEVSRIEVE